MATPAATKRAGNPQTPPAQAQEPSEPQTQPQTPMEMLERIVASVEATQTAMDALALRVDALEKPVVVATITKADSSPATAPPAPLAITAAAPLAPPATTGIGALSEDQFFGKLASAFSCALQAALPSLGAAAPVQSSPPQAPKSPGDPDAWVKNPLAVSKDDYCRKCAGIDPSDAAAALKAEVRWDRAKLARDAA